MRSGRRWSSWWRVSVCLVVAAAIGCSSDDPATAYFVHPTDAWKLKEALDPKAASPVQPSMDWYAEYERFSTPNRSELVVLSGHDEPRLRRELSSFELRTTRVRETSGRAGTGPDGKPAVVILYPGPGYAVMALSYDMKASALIDWIGEIHPATKEQWIAAGGRIVE